MIIQLIPENADEERDIGEVEHKKIKEFFICGVEEDEDGSISDFHNWRGSYKFLIGSLSYFWEEINDKRREYNKNRQQATPIKFSPPTDDKERPLMNLGEQVGKAQKGMRMIKKGDVINPDVQIIDQPENEENDKEK